MQLYDCKLRLDGAVANEIRKTHVTAAEILFLRALHGDDAVLDISPSGTEKREHAEERARLKGIYFQPALTTDERMKQKMEIWRNLFGHDSMELPIRLPDHEAIMRAFAAQRPARGKAEVDPTE